MNSHKRAYIDIFSIVCSNHCCCCFFLARRCDSYSHQLEEEKSKHVLTKHRFEEFRSKAQQEKEMAARLAQNRQDALEREWKDKMHSAEQDVSYCGASNGRV